MIEAARLKALLVADTKGAEQAIDRFGSKLDGLGAAIKRGFGFGAGALASITALRAVDNALDFVHHSVINFNDSLDRLHIAFTNMTGSATGATKFMSELQSFAIATPFHFDKLAQSAQLLLARGIELEHVIPLLNSMGNAAAALGARSDSIDRMTTALSQMAAKGRVQTQELNQLAETGVPSLQILADAYGTTTAEVQKMVEKGEVASGFFINAFAEWSQANFGTMMEKQAHTFSGSMNRITESLQMALARGFRPFFEEVRNIVDKVANALQTDRFMEFSAGVMHASQLAVNGIKNIITQIQSGGIEAALMGVLNTINQMGASWFGAGWNLAVTFAQGLADGARQYIQAVVNEIAAFIASFFVGQSPPPAGPLSQIDKGGENTAKAWVDGFSKGFDDSIFDEANKIRETMESIVPDLSDFEAGIAALEPLLAQVDDALYAIDQQLDDINFEISKLDFEIAEVNREIEAQEAYWAAIIDPIQQQIDALKEVRDWALEIQEIQLGLLDIEAKKLMMSAMGDPAAAADLKAQLAALDVKSQLLDLAEEEAEIKGKLNNMEGAHAADIAELETALDELDVQEQKLKSKLAEAETDAEKKQILIDLEQIEQKRLEKQQKLEELKNKDLSLAKEILVLRLEEIALEKQLLEMIDQKKLEEATYKQELVDSQKEKLALQKEELDLLRQMQILQLEQQLEPILAAREAALAPLREQLAALEAQRDELIRQKEILELQREAWQLLKDDIENLLEPLIAAREEAEKLAAAGGGAGAGLGGLGGGGGAGAGITRPDIPLDIPAPNIEDIFPTDAEMKEMGAKAFEKFADGAKAWLSANAGRVIGGAIGGAIGGFFLGPKGAIIGGLIGAQLGAAIQKELAGKVDFAEFQAKIRGWTESTVAWLRNTWATVGPTVLAVIDRITTDLSMLWSKIVPAAQTMWAELMQTLGPLFAWLDENWHSIKYTVENVWAGIIGVLDFFIAYISNAFGFLHNVLQQDWQAAWENLKNIFFAFSETLMPALTQLGAGLLNGLALLAHGILDWVKDLGPELSVLWEATWELVKEQFGRFTDWVKGDFLDLVGEGLKAVGTWIGEEFVPWVGEQLVKGLEWIWEALKKGLDDNFGFIMDLWTRLETEGIALWDRIRTGIVDIAKGLFSDVVGFFEDIYNGVVGWASDLWYDLVGGSIFPDIRDGIIAVIEALWSKLVGEGGLWQLIKEGAITLMQALWDKLVGDGGLFGTLKDKAIEFMTDMFFDIADGPGSLFGALYSRAVGFMKDMYDEIAGVGGHFANLATKAAEYAEAAYDAFVEWLGDLYSDAKDWGYDLIQGLIDGIEEQLPELLGWIQKVIDALDKIPIVNKITSPSRLWQYWGNMMMEGLNRGLQEGMGPLKKTIDQINNELNVGSSSYTGPLPWDNVDVGSSPYTGPLPWDSKGVSHNLTKPDPDTGIVSEDPPSGTKGPNPGTAMTAGAGSGGSSYGMMYSAPGASLEQQLTDAVEMGFKSNVQKEYDLIHAALEDLANKQEMSKESLKYIDQNGDGLISLAEQQLLVQKEMAHAAALGIKSYAESLMSIGGYLDEALDAVKMTGPTEYIDSAGNKHMIYPNKSVIDANTPKPYKYPGQITKETEVSFGPGHKTTKTTYAGTAPGMHKVTDGMVYVYDEKTGKGIWVEVVPPPQAAGKASLSAGAANSSASGGGGSSGASDANKQLLAFLTQLSKQFADLEVNLPPRMEKATAKGSEKGVSKGMEEAIPHITNAVAYTLHEATKNLTLGGI